MDFFCYFVYLYYFCNQIDIIKKCETILYTF